MNGSVLHFDYETRSDVDLIKCGVEVYVESPNTSAMCAAGAFDDEDVFGFHIGPSNVPQGVTSAFWRRIYDHIANGGKLVAHNAGFEINIWNMLHKRRPDIWPELKPEQVECTMYLCNICALPGKLEKAAPALRLPYAKDMEGHRLMKKLCKPRKPRKNEPKDVLLWHETPADLERQLQYCMSDVPPERAIHHALPPATPRQRAYWLMDQRINARGIQIDVENVRVCMEAAEGAKARLDAEMFQITGGYVKGAGAVKALQEWTASHGWPLPNMQRATVDGILARKDVPSHIRRAIEVRREGAKPSTAKLPMMLKGACSDGRTRGLLTCHGASTGRPTGRRVSPLNLPRTPDEFTVEHAEDVFFWAVDPRSASILAHKFGSALDGISWSLRSLLMAGPGRVLRAADFSNIEGRVLAWYGNEAWKIQAFREFDAGTGPDLYKLACSKSLGIPVDQITKTQRQNIGKVQELLLQFGGSIGAILGMLAKGGNLYKWNGVQMGAAGKLSDIVTAIKAATPDRVWDDAIELFFKDAREAAEEILAARRIEAAIDAEEGAEVSEFEPDYFDLVKECAKTNRYNLEPEEWAALHILVQSWRKAHPGIVGFWRALLNGAIEAVESPGSVVTVGRVQYAMIQFAGADHLVCKLPSGRKIYYPFAHVRYKTVKRKRKSDGSEYEVSYPELFCEGPDSKTKKWGIQYLYGGLLAENVTQAAACCVQMDAQFRLEAAGYPIVLHVYDENVCEMPPEQGSLEEMCAIMSASESWADGLPVAVDGWEGKRYRK